jgi:hypothetical protein
VFSPRDILCKLGERSEASFGFDSTRRISFFKIPQLRFAALNIPFFKRNIAIVRCPAVVNMSGCPEKSTAAQPTVA